MSSQVSAERVPRHGRAASGGPSRARVSLWQIPRTRSLLLLGTFGVAAELIRLLAVNYVDLLWFGELGRRDVFWTTLRWKIAVQGVAGARHSKRWSRCRNRLHAVGSCASTAPDGRLQAFRAPAWSQAISSRSSEGAPTLRVMSAMGRCARKLAGGDGNGADRAPRCERSISPQCERPTPGPRRARCGRGAGRLA